MGNTSEVKDSFITDVSKLVSGTTITQVVGIVISPLLTRLYAPNMFGDLTLFVSITTILSVICCLRYDQALMLPSDDSDASNLLVLALLIVLVLSMLTGSIIFGLVYKLGWFSNQILPAMAVPFTVFAMGSNLALSNWNSRAKKFGRLSWVAVTKILVTSAIQLGAGLAGYATTKSLIGANVAGIVAGIGYLGCLIYWEDGQKILHGFSFENIFRLAGRYRNFALIDTWSALLNSVSWQLPTFLLSYYFSTAITGYYGLAFRVLAVPMGVIGAAIGQVFFQRGASARKSGDLSGVLESVVVQLSILALLPMAVVALEGRDLFAIVFGDRWAESGRYAQVLSVWTFFWFITSPISTVFSILERQRDFFTINLIIFLSRLVALLLGGWIGDPFIALTLYALAGVIAYSWEVFLAIRLADVALIAIVRRVRPYFYVTLAMLGVLVIFHLISTPLLLRLVFSCVVVLGYCLFVAMQEFGLSAFFKKVK